MRRQGRSKEDAEDLTQAFFARFLERNYLEGLRNEKGRFRAFLLAALEHFLVCVEDENEDGGPGLVLGRRMGNGAEMSSRRGQSSAQSSEFKRRRQARVVPDHFRIVWRVQPLLRCLQVVARIVPKGEWVHGPAG